MKDIFMMWNKHMADPDNNFPQLKKIQDDNLDGFPEVDRTEEINALLAAVKLMLKQKGDTLEGKEVVFVDGDRFTVNGFEWESIAKKPYEYSPYGSVFKFSHDITPAKNALGAGGCRDCHGSNSDFFFKEIMAKPFDGHGKALIEKNATFLGYSSFALGFMTFQHETLKPLMFWGFLVIFVLLIFHYVIFGPKRSEGLSSDELFSISFNYKFPIICPDLSLSSLVYVKRIKLNLFYDYADSKLKDDKSIYRSTGVETTFDCHFLRMIVPFDLKTLKAIPKK